MQFFSGRASLRFPGWTRRESRSMDCPHVDELIAAVVNSKIATLHELKNIYSVEDAYNLFEIHAVAKYNEYCAMKEAREKAKEKRG